jgi:Bacterial transcriptional regulator
MPDVAAQRGVVDRVDSTHAVRTFHEIGDTSPMHATATGHAVLAGLPRSDVDEVLAGPLESYGDAAITDPQDLRGRTATRARCQRNYGSLAGPAGLREDALMNGRARIAGSITGQCFRTRCPPLSCSAVLLGQSRE